MIELLLNQILCVKFLLIYPSKIKELLSHSIRMAIHVIVDLFNLSVNLELGIKSLSLLMLAWDCLKPLLIDSIYTSVNTHTLKKLNGLVDESNMFSLQFMSPFQNSGLICLIFVFLSFKQITSSLSFIPFLQTSDEMLL